MDTLETVVAEMIADHGKRRIDTALLSCRPSPESVDKLAKLLRQLVFPGWFESNCGSFRCYLSMLAADVMCLLDEMLLPLLRACADAEEKSRGICLAFLRQIPRIRAMMELDLDAFRRGDPAAAGDGEIIASYPGYYAILIYRLAHELHLLSVPSLPRMLTEHAHSRTGIDIHPGAQIGQRFFIDHGTGVVIGETTVIGENVKIYQGVTLGALSTRGGSALRGKKRHPTIGNDVTIYAGASILGGETVIGDGATIGGNAFLTASVAPGSKVLPNP